MGMDLHARVDGFSFEIERKNVTVWDSANAATLTESLLYKVISTRVVFQVRIEF